VCDQLDNDCDGTVDEGYPLDTYYADSDGDGYGDLSAPLQACAAPAGYVLNSLDCDDGNAGIHPSATERCNGVDDDCDGMLDGSDPGLADESVRVSVKVYLQGPYISAVQLMHDSLRVKNLIPLTEPYTGLTGFSHAGGGGGEATTAAVLSVGGPDAVVDWVFLELRNAAAPAQVLSTCAALVQRDGDVVGADGVSAPQLAAPSGFSYYLAVRHRNHLGAQPGDAGQYPACDALATDFRNLTPSAMYSYNGLNPAQKVISGKYTLWSGNGRVDPQLKYNGSNNDRTAILSVVGLTTPNAVVPGYRLQDYNLDGVVKYNGAANDRNVLLGNVGITTPSAVVEEQVAR
jgi:hypothetical protein